MTVIFRFFYWKNYIKNQSYIQTEKIQGFTKNTKAFKSVFKDATNKTNPKFLCQLVCKLQCIKHDKANLLRTGYFSL